MSLFHLSRHSILTVFRMYLRSLASLATGLPVWLHVWVFISYRPPGGWFSAGTLYYDPLEVVLLLNTPYAQRAPRARAADRPARGWAPAGRIIMP
jgi:hypothetical protein